LDEKPLVLRLRWNGPVPPHAPHPGETGSGLTEFGMSSGRDVVVRGLQQADGSILHEAAVTAYTDSKGRLRFRGPCVQGPPDAPFLYLSYRYVGMRGWIGRGKAYLTSLTEDVVASLPDGAVLESTMGNLGHRPAGHVQTWVRVQD
jgi:hypothetical protein